MIFADSLSSVTNAVNQSSVHAAYRLWDANRCLVKDNFMVCPCSLICFWHILEVHTH